MSFHWARLLAEGCVKALGNYLGPTEAVMRECPASR